MKLLLGLRKFSREAYTEKKGMAEENEKFR